MAVSAGPRRLAGRTVALLLVWHGATHSIGFVESFSTPSRVSPFQVTRPSNALNRSQMTSLHILTGNNDGNARDDLDFFNPTVLESEGKTLPITPPSILEPRLTSLIISLAMVMSLMLSFGGEAVAQTLSTEELSASPMLVAADIANDVLSALTFVGDLVGSILNLLYQVLLVLIPILGKAIAAAFQAALPAIKEGTQAFGEYFKVAAKASGEAAKPYVNEAVQASTPYLKQFGTTVNEATSAAGNAVQGAASEQIKTVNSAIQNVAAQAKPPILK